MATMYEKGRTNYVKLDKYKTLEELKVFASRLESNDSGTQLDTVTRNGTVYFAFLGTISGLLPENFDYENGVYDNDFDDFIKGIQPFLDNDSTMIYKEVYFEAYRYLSAFAHIIGKDWDDYIDLDTAVIDYFKEKEVEYVPAEYQTLPSMPANEAETNFE
jgi:hypothetical protein